MKKTLLLLVGGLLIAFIAGPALADPFEATVYTKDSNNVYHKLSAVSPINLLPSQEIELYLGGYGFTSNYLDTDYNWDNALIGAPAGYETSLIVQSPPEKFHPPATAPTEDNPYICPYPIKIKLQTGVPAGLGFKINLGADKNGILTATGDWDIQSRDIGSIPEFPTVALPVAAILGLLFIFGRKKGDL